ncbi:hypothetical protein [Loktanella salsilacus]|uniref:hypothetical protein n=1 Tax=Loktanella salsilacus TaxID=195913 RepID=UPI0011138EC5|nr:hypothetical protein [Loktanella salsilacus]
MKTTNPDLAEQINSACFTDAKAKVMAILVEILANLPDEAVQLLPKHSLTQWHNVSQNQIDALDDRYFDSEEGGDAEKAVASFIAARFLAAVKFWQTAANQFGLCEAAYEASFANEQNR